MHRFSLEAVDETCAAMVSRSPGTGKVLVLPQEQGADEQEHDGHRRAGAAINEFAP